MDKCHDHPGCGDRIFTALDSLCSAVKAVGHNLLRGQTGDAGFSDWTLLSLSGIQQHRCHTLPLRIFRGSLYSFQLVVGRDFVAAA